MLSSDLSTNYCFVSALLLRFDALLASKNARSANSPRILPACPVECPNDVQSRPLIVRAAAMRVRWMKAQDGAADADGDHQSAIALPPAMYQLLEEGGGSKVAPPWTSLRLSTTNSLPRLTREPRHAPTAALAARGGRTRDNQVFGVKRLLALAHGRPRGPLRLHRRRAPAKSAAVACAHPRGFLPGLVDCGPAATPSLSQPLPQQRPSP